MKKKKFSIFRDFTLGWTDDDRNTMSAWAIVWIVSGIIMIGFLLFGLVIKTKALDQLWANFHPYSALADTLGILLVIVYALYICGVGSAIFENINNKRVKNGRKELTATGANWIVWALGVAGLLLTLA